jgi:hypothetical protein
MLWMLFYPPAIKHGNGKSIENPSLISRLLSHSNILKQHLQIIFQLSMFFFFQQDVFSYRWTSKYFPPRGLKTLEDAGPHNSNLEVAVGSLHAVLAGRLGLKSNMSEGGLKISKDHPLGLKNTDHFGIVMMTGWWYTYPSEQYESQLGLLFPICGKIKHVPNHHPDNYNQALCHNNYGTCTLIHA